MFERFRPKTKTIIQEKKFEIPAEVIKAVNEKTEQGHEAKMIFVEYLKTLDRVDFLRVGDLWPKIWNDKHRLHDWLWEAISDTEWDLSFPSTKGLYELIKTESYESSPITYRKGKDGKDLDLNKIEDTVIGLQKKLDRIVTLLETAEFKLTGKQALKL